MGRERVGGTRRRDDSVRDRWLTPCLTTESEHQVRRDFSKEIHRLPEERRQLIFRIRRQLAEGTYPIDDHWELALDRLGQKLDLESSDRFSQR